MSKDYETVGQTIYIAADVIVKTGREVEALLHRFKEIVENELIKMDVIKEGGITKGKIDSANDDYNWICLDYVTNYKIVWAGDRKPKVYLALLILLKPDSEDFQGYNEPLLHVLFSPEGEGEWDTDFKWAWNDEDLEGSKLYIGFNKLQAWISKEDNDPLIASWWKRMWAFSLPLAAINNTEDIKNQLVAPIMALLSDGDIDGAFSNADKVLQFKVEGNAFVLLET